MPQFPITARNRVRRMPERGHYDRKTVNAIIDEALVCHVAFVVDGVPTVIPTLHARRGDDLLLHGARTDARQPSRKELRATTVVSIPIDVAAAKIRTGPPLDDEEDYSLPIWAGVLPLSLRPGAAIPDPRLDHDVDIPGYVRRYGRPGQ